jgi:hypothetical protein
VSEQANIAARDAEKLAREEETQREQQRQRAEQAERERRAAEAAAKRKVEEARRQAAAAEAKRKVEEERRAAAELEIKRRADEIARLSARVEKHKGSPTLPPTAISSGPRVALVIGNANYANAIRLNNPANDAKAVAAILRRLGFVEVIERYDLGIQQLRSELKSFGDQAASADWAVVYFAGHGIQVNQTNYLIATDAQLVRASHVEDEAVALPYLLSKVEDAGQLRLVILDACRTNPFLARMEQASGSRALGRGLGRIEPQRGVLVAYAARDGQLAQDGVEGNSPFTKALLEHIEEPGLEIGLLFRKVRDTVLKRTGNAQEPFVYGSLPSEGLYFKAAGQ